MNLWCRRNDKIILRLFFTLFPTALFWDYSGINICAHLWKMDRKCFKFTHECWWILVWCFITQTEPSARVKRRVTSSWSCFSPLTCKRLKLCTSSHPDSDKSCCSDWLHHQTSNQWNQYPSRLVTSGSEQKKMEILVLRSAAVLGCLWSALERTAGLPNFNSSQTPNSLFAAV